MGGDPSLADGEYPFIMEKFPLRDLAWIEVPESLEALLLDQIRVNGIQLIRGQPVELRCMTPQHGDAIFMVFWPHDGDRLHMLAPKVFQTGKA